MEYTKRLDQFLEKYDEYKTYVLQPTHDEVSEYLKKWESPEYWKKLTLGKSIATPSPIRMIITRIKTPEKVVDKIYRRPNIFPHELSIKSLKGMRDIIGVRIVVYFASQLSIIDRELRSSDTLELSQENPPKAYFASDALNKLGLSHIRSKQKESGYSSIHYSVKLKNSSIPKEERPDFEIQVRTLAQDVWGELEHALSYKPETRPHFSAKRRFQILSREIEVIDEHFNLLYEELIHNQEIASYKESDTLTFENLPKVMSDIGIQCALTDLNPILKIFFSREITTVADLFDIASPRRMTTIRNTYIARVGHTPSNVDLVAMLAVLKTVESKDAEIERIKSQIEIINQKFK